jgi:prepilin-type N-terminal cleavage/methylation domain-containing protein
MRLRPTTCTALAASSPFGFGRTAGKPGSYPGLRGFTLVEVLAALAFMAIVIPVAVSGLQIANRAGQVADRKSAAARIGQKVLNEAIVIGTWKSASEKGTVEEGPRTYTWTLKSGPWNKEVLTLVTVDVTYTVQGQDFDVRLSTLVDGTAITTTTAP